MSIGTYYGSSFDFGMKLFCLGPRYVLFCLALPCISLHCIALHGLAPVLALRVADFGMLHTGRGVAEYDLSAGIVYFAFYGCHASLVPSHRTSRQVPCQFGRITPHRTALYSRSRRGASVRMCRCASVSFSSQSFFSLRVVPFRGPRCWHVLAQSVQNFRNVFFPLAMMRLWREHTLKLPALAF